MLTLAFYRVFCPNPTLEQLFLQRKLLVLNHQKISLLPNRQYRLDFCEFFCNASEAGGVCCHLPPLSEHIPDLQDIFSLFSSLFDNQRKFANCEIYTMAAVFIPDKSLDLPPDIVRQSEF
jgi:hypothetical protein